MPDPKLKQAVKEIQVILKKHDIAAVVSLQSQTHGEFYYHLTPSWSCATLDKTTGAFRFKAAVATGAPAEKERARKTSGMLVQFLNDAERQRRDMDKVTRMLGEHLQITHWFRDER